MQGCVCVINAYRQVDNCRLCAGPSTPSTQAPNAGTWNAGGPLFRGLGELKSTAGQLAVVSGEVGSGASLPRLGFVNLGHSFALHPLHTAMWG